MQLFTNAPCFYYPRVGYMVYTDGTIQFENNHAKNGIGHHIYGGSIHDSRCNFVIHYYDRHLKEPFCHRYHEIFTFLPDLARSPSVVSSSAMRVCLCDASGKHQCDQLTKVFLTDIAVYSGETFNLSIIIVGYDFGVQKERFTAASFV